MSSAPLALAVTLVAPRRRLDRRLSRGPSRFDHAVISSTYLRRRGNSSRHRSLSKTSHALHSRRVTIAIVRPLSRPDDHRDTTRPAPAVAPTETLSRSDATTRPASSITSEMLSHSGATTRPGSHLHDALTTRDESFQTPLDAARSPPRPNPHSFERDSITAPHSRSLSRPIAGATTADRLTRRRHLRRADHDASALTLSSFSTRTRRRFDALLDRNALTHT